MISYKINQKQYNLTYDQRNRLIQINDIVYKYDSENTKIQRQEKDKITNYITDPNANLSKLLIKYDNQGNITKYIYGNGLIGQEENGIYSNYHYDNQGNTTHLTDKIGQMKASYTYDPYGNITSEQGSIDTIFKYSGKYGVQEEPNNLLYMRSRYYQVEIGRFITSDSYEGNKLNILSQNRYTYVEGNPINYIDPLGLHPATRQYDKFGNYKTTYNTVIVNIDGRNILKEYALLTRIALKQSTIKQEKVITQGLGIKPVDSMDGMIGRLGASAIGIDIVADVNDVIYDLSHFECTPGHFLNLGIDLIGLLPAVGMAKNLKYVDDITIAVKNDELIKQGLKQVTNSSGEELEFTLRSGIEQVLKNTDEYKVKLEKDIVKNQVQSAAEQLKQLEGQIQGTHFYSRHGAHITKEQLLERAKTGLTPDGYQKFPADSSSFISDEIQLDAYKKVYDEYKTSGKLKFDIELDDIVGGGYLR